MTRQVFGETSLLYRALSGSYATGLSRLNDVDWLYKCVPPGEHRVGQVRDWMEKESPLWYPYQARQVFSIRREDTPQSVRAKGLTYVVITAYGLDSVSNFKTIEDWCRYYDAREISHRTCDDTEVWTVVALNPQP